MALTYSSPIGREDRKETGAAGLIVRDTGASQFIAITSGLVAAGPCFEDGSKKPIGTTFPLPRNRYFGARLRPAWTLLTAIALREDIRLGEGRVKSKSGFVFPSLGGDTRRFVGEAVFAHLPGRESVEALLVGSQAKFAMPVHDTKGPVFFEEALELFFVGDQERARRRDAGALVTAADGSVLGVIVAASGTSTFAAPVAPVLEQLGNCVALSGALIERHNASRGKGESNLRAREKKMEAEPVDPMALSDIWQEANAIGTKGALIKAATLLADECLV